MTIKCIEDLRILTNKNLHKNYNIKLGDKALTVLQHLVNHPGSAAVDSIGALAKKTNVDPSTLTRLGKNLGLTGFSELQAIFRNHVAESENFYSGRIHEHLLSQNQSSTKETIRQHARTESKKLIHASQLFHPQLIERATELIANAKHVYVLALRATYSLAFFLGSYLETLRDDVTVLGGPGATFTSDILRIKPEDLLIAISFQPYTKAVVTAVDLIKETKTPLIAITDNNSEIFVNEKQGVTLQVDCPFHFDSASAHFFIIQHLLLASAKRLGKRAFETTKRREYINKALNIEVS